MRCLNAPQIQAPRRGKRARAFQDMKKYFKKRVLDLKCSLDPQPRREKRAKAFREVSEERSLGASRNALRRGISHHLPERALAVRENLTNQWFRIRV